jgi:hypothetical protein
MKKLILMSILIFASLTTSAQSLNETMDFIGANLNNYAYSKEFSTKCTNNALEMPTANFASDNSRKNYTKVFMKHIKSVNYSIGASDTRIITIVGQCFLFEFEKLVVDQVEPQSISILLLPTTPIENVNRIIKAIKHAAELEGAELINDDLFKD